MTETMTYEERQRAAIRTILSSPDWTEGEKFVVRWQCRLLGDFKTALINAIKLADEENLARLALGFPEEVRGFQAWAHGGLARRLRATGLDI